MASTYTYRRTIPLAIAFVVTILMILGYFTTINIKPIEDVLLSWSVVITTSAIGLGIINLIQHHARKISERKGNEWLFSILLLVCLVFTVAVGLIYGGESEAFQQLYNASLAPLGATLMSVFIVWIAPAFARYLVPRNISSGILVLTILLCMFSGGPIGQAIHPNMSAINQWILTVGAMGAQRGLKITIGLGMLLISLRIITGREKSFMREEVS
jgi:magnesium-transporting ATPase (P-type)